MNWIWRENFISSTASKYPKIHFWTPVCLVWLCLCNSWDKGAKLARRFWKNKKAWPYRSIFEAKHMSSPVFISWFMTYYGKIIFYIWTSQHSFALTIFELKSFPPIWHIEENRQQTWNQVYISNTITLWKKCSTISC